MSLLYTVKHAAQSPEIRSKMKASAFAKDKKYTIGDREHSVMGYEPQFLNIAFGVKPLCVPSCVADKFTVPLWVADHQKADSPVTSNIRVDSVHERPDPVNYMHDGVAHRYFPDAEMPAEGFPTFDVYLLS
eukprot:TRINITY_DN56508_c0_g1_i1.p3 TRINITY_DN56508_c0_g1~~TRINITY_DN56508_c0_g1_i1.p3  ORF type:complete len:131 (+),score=13.61 TRINITY_DN56508_c0_g1_i1:225-617(+)